MIPLHIQAGVCIEVHHYKSASLTGSVHYSCICLFSGMSEVSLEAESERTSAEDPQVDCEDGDKAGESLSEDVKQESVDPSRGRDYTDEEMYDVDINSNEENAENSDKDVQEEDEAAQSEGVVTHRDGDAADASGSAGEGGHETNHHVERAETPVESGDSHTETKVIFTFTLVNQSSSASLLANHLALPYCICVCSCCCFELDLLWGWRSLSYLINLLPV